MLHTKEQCPYCRQGLLGFFVQRDEGVVLVCDECDLAYPSPNKAKLIDSFEINATDPFVDGRWASRVEIEDAGLAEFVAGEKPDARDGKGSSTSAA